MDIGKNRGSTIGIGVRGPSNIGGRNNTTVPSATSSSGAFTSTNNINTTDLMSDKPAPTAHFPKSLLDLTHAASNLGMPPSTTSATAGVNPTTANPNMSTFIPSDPAAMSGGDGLRLLSSIGIDTTRLADRARNLERISQSSASAPPSTTQTSSTPSRRTRAPLNSTLESIRQTHLTNLLHRQAERTREQMEQHVIRHRMEQAEARMQQYKNSILTETGRRLPRLSPQARHEPQVLHPSTSMGGRTMSPLQQEHLIQFQKSHLTSWTGMIDLAQSLSQTHLKYMPYVHATKLLSCMHDQESSSTTTLALTSRASSSSPQASSSQPLTHNAMARATGSVLFLAEQFRHHVESRVKTATSTEGLESVGGGGFVGMVWKFVELEVGRDLVQRGGVEVVWRCIYYCLRCGDVHAASTVLESCHEIHPALSHIFNHLKSTTISSKNSILLSPMNLPSNLYQVSMDNYQRSILNQSNEFERATWALLSANPDGLQQDGIGKVVNVTIEDYLFMGLWNVIHVHAELSQGGVSQAIVAGGQETSVGMMRLMDLAKSIKEWGPEYFQGGAGWTYAMPLLLCGELESALVHLANSSVSNNEDDVSLDGLCVAAHLALGLVQGNMAVVNVDSTSEQGIDSSIVPESIVSALVTAYARTIQMSSPEAALAYLIRIPAESVTNSPPPSTRIWTKTGVELGPLTTRELCRLIKETKAYTQLAGRMAPDGSRQAVGALDQYLGPKAVSDLLALAAEQSLLEGNITDAAELLSFAGRYSDLLLLLNRELASRLERNSAESEARTFWRDAALRFHATFLTQGGRTHVVQVLEREGNLHLGETFQNLLNLMAFMDRCVEREWLNAWEVVDNLQFFPARDEEVAKKVESFHSLATEVKEIFHQIITHAMECLSHAHSSLKGNPTGGVTQQRMHEIRNRARLLVTFAGLIPINQPSETKNKISKLEAYMI